MPDAQERFDRYFEGVWKRRWWTFWGLMSAPELVEIKTYKSGEITGGIVAVTGVADNGTRITFEIKPTATRIPGYKRTSAPALNQKQGPPDA